MPSDTSSAGVCAPSESGPEGSQIVEEWMNPSTIRFSQASISAYFSRRPLQSRKADDPPSSNSRGAYSEALKATPVQSIFATLQQLRDGSLSVEEIPRIRVCKHDGIWYSLDNRRLWVFQEFGKPIPVQIEEPSKEFFQKLTREDDGRSVRIANPNDKEFESKESESFLSTVLRWSVDDILNDRMYVNKVQPIPLKFPNVQAYYKAFQWPLLEDTRGHIQHSVEAIGTAPYIALRSIEDLTSPIANKKNQLRKLELTKFIVGKNSVERNAYGAPWKPKPTDMVVLCTLVPEDFEDLRRSGELYTFAQIQSADKDDFEDSVFIKVVAYLPEECREYKEILEGKRLWYAVFLDNLATANRIWDALNPGPLMLNQPQRPVVEETLYTEDPQATANSDGVRDTDDGLEALLEKYCHFRRLNESQTEAVRCTVMEFLQERGFRVRLVQGPPGTGKTSTLVALVSIASCLIARILVCAPTNRAVSEIAVRFLELLRSNLQDTCQFSDLTCPALIGTRFCRPLQFCDVVLVGNEERLDTETILGEIFLPHRTKRLLEALSPRSGWRHSAEQIVNLLRDYEDEYEVYVEVWRENQQKENDEAEKDKAEKDEAQTPLLDFLQFMRKRLNLIGPNMIKNGQIMCNDLSSKRISEDSKKGIQDSCLVVRKLLEALTDESLTGPELRDCFTGTCRLNNVGNGKCGSDICSAREKFLDIMTTQPGYFPTGYGPVVIAEQIEENCLKDACLVFSTTSSAGRRVVKTSGRFEYAVIDEAAQLVEAETAIVTQLPGIKRAVLVGDPKQLQALVFSQIAKDSGYGRSLFERLQELGHPCQLLNVQYRMHPDISLFPNRQFYNGVISDGPNVLSEKYKKSYQDFYGPYAFIDVRDGSEERDEKGISWKNPVEAEVVQFLINKIQADTSESLDVGVIAPYKSQVELMMKRNYSGRMALPSGASIQVDVKTVDGFQGGEKDVILFSAVRANSGGHIGFVEDARRLNVALTRGRYCVWIVGNSETLAAYNEMWRALVVDAKKRNCYWDAQDDQGLRKCILRVKKELEQYASLLHHNSVLFKDTVWKITFSKEFKETITQIKSVQSRQTILNTILNLANGRRSPYPTKCNIAAEKYAKMIHVQPTAGLTLVWTIDVDKCGDPVKQMIKIWNAVESSYIPGLIRRLEAGFSTYTGPYVDRCSTTSFPKKIRKVVVPAFWKLESSFTWYEVSESVRKRAGAVLEENVASPVESRLEKASVDESILLMKFYSLTSGIARQLLTARDGSNMELLFEVNDEEATIIQYPFSTFILGRSGTGKTTVITTRLLKLEQQFRSAVSGFAIKSQEETSVKVEGVANFQAEKIVAQPLGTECLRQVIVTLSPKLCGAIKHHIAKTSRTMLAEDSVTVSDNADAEEDVMLDEEEETKLMGGIPDTLVNITPDSFPLVITFRKFLAMVDGSVFCPFFLQHNSYITDEKARFEGFESSSSDAEEAENECASFSEVDQEEEREYFDSNDQEEDEDSDFSSVDGGLDGEEEDPLAANPGRKQLENSKNLGKRMTEVTFEHFISFYWPHFSQDLVKHFDSSVVFTEIISFIKGSLEVLHTEHGRLSRKQYLSLAAKRTSMFDERQRNSIYSIFLQYERYKAVRREYDIADYCTHLHAQLRLGKYVGLKFHYIYVDEVQDLTMSQIALLKYVCSNVEEGYVFAGDTAQTIARGVSFRFQDISHLFYTEFLGKGDDSLEKSHGKRQRALEDIDLNRGNFHGQTTSKHGKATGGKTPHMPNLKLHYLSHNFRTHVGIVNIANSIVQLLYNFFPNTVDRLNPESSLIQGETPIFLEREENYESVTSLFGHGGAAGGGGCDFGAEQVILVRDMATKHQITEKLGRRGLVMSVLECKGLEFQDVLLYNFFSDSLLGSKWRVIYSYMAENSTAEDGDGKPLSFPQFNIQKHNLLMSELKQLYVVVTRARQRLWIYDECPEHHKPMLNFWNNSGLIQVKRLDEDLIRTIHGKSTPEDWKRRGIQMFNDHHYDMAQISFERAGDLHRANWAKAAGLQQAGERQSDPKASAQLFREAATLFLSLGKGESAAKCHLKIGDNRKAGMIFRDSCKPPRLEEAGDSFMDAKCWSEAADSYAKAWCFRQCLVACLKGKLLDLGVDLLYEWEQQLSSRNREGGDDRRTQVVDGDEFELLKVEYLKKCALHYHKQRNSELMMKFIRRLPSIASQKVFLKRRDYFDQLIEVEEGEGNFLKAAEMAEQKGDLKYAVQLLVQGGCHEQAVEKLLDRAMFTMLWSGGKPGWPLVSTAESEDLLDRANGIISSGSSDIRSHLLQELKLLLVPKSGLENWKLVEGSSNIRHQIIAGRQAIDEILLRSTATNASFIPELLLTWDSWSQKLMALIQAINRAQRRREKAEDEVLLHSSNKYLGAVEHSQPHLFVVTDVASSWLKNIQISRLPNQGQRGQVSSEQLFFLSEAFWVNQLWKAGLEIIKVIEVVLFNTNDLVCAVVEATSFATECFEPRGEQLCKLYSITKSLADIMSKNITQDEHLYLQQRLRRYGDIIYDASFPHRLKKESWGNVLTFQEGVGTIYDSIASGLAQELVALDLESGLDQTNYETVGRIQMLLPLLSRQWLRKYGTNLQNRLKHEDWSNMWDESYRMYYILSEHGGQSPENICETWVDAVEGYCGSLKKVYTDLRRTLMDAVEGYRGSLKKVYTDLRRTLSPFVFIQLLERGIVVDLACHTNLHSLILPESLVVNHMTGDMNTNLFTAILNVGCKCKGPCFQFTTIRFVLRLILDMLSSDQVETWFAIVEIDWRVSLPSLIFRMLVAVLTVCINLRLDPRTRGAHDLIIWDNAIKTLRTVFTNRSPLLRGQPPEFDAALSAMFFSRSPHEAEVRVKFMKAMAAVNDPLIVLKHGGYGKRIASWAHKHRLRRMFITRKRANGVVFGTFFSSREKPVSLAKPKDVNNGIIPSLQNHGSEKLNGLPNPELQRQEFEEASGRSVHSDAQESVVPKSDSLNSLSDNVDVEEEMAMDEEEHPEDVWIDDGSTEGPRLASRTIPAGHVSIGEGQTLAIFFKNRLLQLLEDAQQRLKEELSATEKYRRDARTTFRKLIVQRKEYFEFFLSEACPLKATADEWLRDLETAVQALKDDDNFDEIVDSQEALQKAMAILDPRSEEHVAQDLQYLEKKLEEVRHLMETGKQRFQKQIDMLGIRCQNTDDHDGEILSKTAEGEINTSANKAKAVKSQKRKPKEKKKKKKGKR